MPKFPALKAQAVIKVLEKIGFVCVRQKGSHKIFTKNHCFVTVPYHHKELKPKTLKHVIRKWPKIMVFYSLIFKRLVDQLFH